MSCDIECCRTQSAVWSPHSRTMRVVNGSIAMKPTFHGKSADILYTVFAAAVACFIVVALAINLVHAAGQPKPRTGDLLIFSPAKQTWLEVEPVEAMAIGKGSSHSCILDPRVMKAFGGSVLVESTQLRPTLSFRVHWVGQSTSDKATDCGPAADLQLDDHDLDAMSLSAGGSG
jgi:hypothetical protein